MKWPAEASNLERADRWNEHRGSVRAQAIHGQITRNPSPKATISLPFRGGISRGRVQGCHAHPEAFRGRVPQDARESEAGLWGA